MEQSTVWLNKTATAVVAASLARFCCVCRSSVFLMVVYDGLNIVVYLSSLMQLMQKPSVVQDFSSSSHSNFKRPQAEKKIYIAFHILWSFVHALWMNKGLNISSILSISSPRTAYSVLINIFENCVLVPFISSEGPSCRSNLPVTLLMPCSLVHSIVK